LHPGAGGIEGPFALPRGGAPGIVGAALEVSVHQWLPGRSKPGDRLDPGAAIDDEAAARLPGESVEGGAGAGGREFVDVAVEQAMGRGAEAAQGDAHRGDLQEARPVGVHLYRRVNGTE